MKIVIDAEPTEIAALVAALQERQRKDVALLDDQKHYKIEQLSVETTRDKYARNRRIIS